MMGRYAVQVVCDGVPLPRMKSTRVEQAANCVRPAVLVMVPALRLVHSNPKAW